METDEKVISALQQLHDDIKELTQLVAQNHQTALNQGAIMKRTYVAVVALVFVAMFLYPWAEKYLPR